MAMITTKNERPPLELLICIINNELVPKALKVLNKITLLNFNASGTTSLIDVDSVFDFDLQDRQVFMGLFDPEKNKTILKRLNKQLALEETGNGIAFTVLPSSFEAQVLVEYFGKSMGGENNG